MTHFEAAKHCAASGMALPVAADIPAAAAPGAPIWLQGGSVYGPLRLQPEGCSDWAPEELMEYAAGVMEGFGLGVDVLPFGAGFGELGACNDDMSGLIGLTGVGREACCGTCTALEGVCSDADTGEREGERSEQAERASERASEASKAACAGREGAFAAEHEHMYMSNLAGRRGGSGGLPPTARGSTRFRRRRTDAGRFALNLPRA
jgi:hypothetical protein